MSRQSVAEALAPHLRQALMMSRPVEDQDGVLATLLTHAELALERVIEQEVLHRYVIARTREAAGLPALIETPAEALGLPMDERGFLLTDEELADHERACQAAELEPAGDTQVRPQ